MAVRTKAIVNLKEHRDRDVHIITWTGLLQSTLDTGDPFEGPGSADRSVQVEGVLGVGGNLRIEGSNDGVLFQVLHDPTGADLDFAALGVEAVSEVTRFIRPRVTAGDGTTSFVVTLLVRRNR
jgi:hypothetical protein